MRVSVLSALALLPAVAYAQNSSATAAYLQGVLQALTAANLTSLVTVASAIANTTDGLALLSSLATGNKTVFAPSNAAFANVSSAVASNTTLLTQILSYHILNTTYAASGVATAPAHTIARTLLKGNGYSLPGNFSAPLVLSNAAANASSFNIIQATDNFTAQGPAMAGNLAVYIIPEVLTLPPNVSTIAGELFPSLAGVIQETGLLAPLSASPGLTIFAPNNAAVAAAASSLGSNVSLISTVLANHVINGSVVYSTGLTSANYTSAAGEPFTFISNSSGAYVMSAASTAKIVQSDIIINNGVVHLIDGILLNTMANSTAAAAAYSSAVNAAATSTEATGPVTATSSAATGAATTSKASSAGRLEALNGHSFVGPVIAVAGMVAGGGYLLL